MEDLVNTCIVLGIPVAAVLWLIARRRRAHRRDARLAAAWSWAYSVGQNTPAALVPVCRVYQRASTGTKADIRWGNGVLQDAWFQSFAAVNGTWVLATGDTGYGRHNRNPNVFRVWRGKVQTVLPADAPAAYARHAKRVARRATKHPVTTA